MEARNKVVPDHPAGFAIAGHTAGGVTVCNCRGSCGGPSDQPSDSVISGHVAGSVAVDNRLAHTTYQAANRGITGHVPRGKAGRNRLVDIRPVPSTDQPANSPNLPAADARYVACGVAGRDWASVLPHKSTDIAFPIHVARRVAAGDCTGAISSQTANTVDARYAGISTNVAVGDRASIHTHQTAAIPTPGYINPYQPSFPYVTLRRGVPE